MCARVLWHLMHVCVCVCVVQAPYGKVLQQLGLTVIAPLAVGQVIQYLLPKVVAWLQVRL